MLGEHGEKRAADFLLQKNFSILDTNFQVGTHEIDIVAMDNEVNELVFVEVKTRSEAFFGNPSDAVDRVKFRALRRAAALYISAKKLWHLDYRFDIIAVLPNSIDHYQNVTWGMVK